MITEKQKLTGSISGSNGVSGQVKSNGRISGGGMVQRGPAGPPGPAGPAGPAGAPGVHIGTDTPPEDANVWVIPEGRPTSTEDWEFDLETGETDTKTVVVVDSDEAAASGELGILRVRQADGTWKEIPAIVGERGADGYTPVKGVDYFDGEDGKDGSDGKDGRDGYTPQKNVDYFDGKDGYTPVKGVDYFDGEKGDTGESGVVSPVSGFYTLSVDEEGNLWVTSEDGNAPNFQYDSATGNLYVVADGTNVLIGNVKGIQGDRGADGYTPVKGKDYFDGEDGYTPQKGVDYFDGKDGSNGKDGSDGVSCKHSWNGTTLTVTSASGTSSADLKGSKGDKGDTGEVDYSRLDNYAKLKSPNDMLHNGNEFTFIPASHTGELYINYRTASGAKDGNISNYHFCNGAGGEATVMANYFKGKFQGADSRPIYNNAEVAMLSDIPTLATENWTFTLEDGSTVTKSIYVQ